MSQWKSFANVAGMPKFSAAALQQGSGNVNQAANNATLIGNTTPGAVTAHGKALNENDGIFPVTPLNKANTTGEASKVHGLGWALRTGGLGPITTLTATNGSGFGTGETVLVSGGSVNAVASLTPNTTGNLQSASVLTTGFYPNGSAITTIGVFPNTSNLTVTFTRERHVANLNFANSTALTNVGNANTINVSIANTNIPYGVNATSSLVSNSTGGITNSITQALTWSNPTWGLFSNAQTNTAVVITFTNANGSVVGGTFTATANLVTSTAGTVTVTKLGGRAGRVTYELLVVDRHIANGTTSFANTAQLPSN